MDKYIYAKNSVEFVTVGVEFCAFLERVQELTQEEFASTSIKLLPLLYLKATLLPIDDENEDYLDSPEHFVTEDDYEFLRENIGRLMGENDAYLVVQTDEMKYSDLPLGASIAEDMADIYQAVKDCIAAYRTENEDTMRVALTECREEFSSYWGSKLLNALAALQRACKTIRRIPFSIIFVKAVQEQRIILIDRHTQRTRIQRTDRKRNSLL